MIVGSESLELQMAAMIRRQLQNDREVLAEFSTERELARWIKENVRSSLNGDEFFPIGRLVLKALDWEKFWAALDVPSLLRLNKNAARRFS